VETLLRTANKQRWRELIFNEAWCRAMSISDKWCGEMRPRCRVMYMPHGEGCSIWQQPMQHRWLTANSQDVQRLHTQQWYCLTTFHHSCNRNIIYITTGTSTKIVMFVSWLLFHQSACFTKKGNFLQHSVRCKFGTIIITCFNSVKMYALEVIATRHCEHKVYKTFRCHKAREGSH